MTPKISAITGTRIRLRGKKLADAVDDFAWHTDPELVELDAASLLKFTFPQYLSAFLEDLRLQSPKRCAFAIETLSGIQQRLILSLINAAGECLHDGIVTEPWMVDLGMVLGTGFAPFRGGPLRVAQGWGETHVAAAIKRLESILGPRFRPSEFWSGNSTPSNSPAAEKSVSM